MVAALSSSSFWGSDLASWDGDSCKSVCLVSGNENASSDMLAAFLFSNSDLLLLLSAALLTEFGAKDWSNATSVSAALAAISTSFPLEALYTYDMS